MNCASTIWQGLAVEVERRGAAAVLADVERAAAVAGGRCWRDPRHATPTAQLGVNSSLIIRLTNELLGVQAGARRAVIIARDLAAQKEHGHG